MKNSFIIILFVLLTSCNNNYNNAVEFLEKAKNSNSQAFLDDAKFELSLLNNSQKNDENVIKLSNDIISFQKKLDSISNSENIKRIEYLNKEVIYKINKEKEKNEEVKRNIAIENKRYPNLVGKWRTYQTNYLKIVNGIVRIYKKNGSFYISKVFDKDGSEYNRKLKKIKNKYYEIGKSDYVIIKSNGELEHRDKEGYLMTSKKYDDKFIPTIKKLTNNINVVDVIGEDIFKFRFEYGLEDFKTIEGTNNQNWVTFYPKFNLTLISDKNTDVIKKFYFENN